MQVNISGSVTPGFEKVEAVFTSLWDEIEVGASFCAWYRGEKIVDLWGGYTDPEMAQPWQHDTLVNVYSTTKGLGSLAFAILVDEGKVSYEDKVTDYWPEFGAAGKQDVTIAQLLSHQAGLCGVETRLSVADLYDWDKMINLLAAQKPLWLLGQGAGYHAITWGYFPGELIRRITGQTLGQYFREKVTDKLQADFFIGLPDSELSRCATMIGPNRARKLPPAPEHPVKMPELYPIALLNPSVSPFRDASSDVWRKAEIAAANGQASAAGIARIYAALSCGGQLGDIRIISEEALAQATRIEVDMETDLVTGRPMRRARGFMLNTEGAYGPSMNAFGHAGAGGSLGFADPDNQVAVGYAMNQMQADADAVPRSKQLTDAVYDCIARL
ncbi:MAG: beta-lactamase family protein [Pseudomonadales bacterium]|nr:beta-lactamase family protein [Pseudomonadales bacterium]